MSDANTVLSPPVTTEARRSRRISPMWLIPILALVLGAWLAWDAYSKRGPTITVLFGSGEGLTPGQSQLRYKDIVLGTVRSVDLTPDHQRVLVHIATTSQATPLLTDHAVFWVAKPRLFAGTISGLETLVSGNYVAMLPGTGEGHPQRAFVGQEDPPILTATTPGKTFLLKAPRIGSISAGGPVFFRDMPVGEILGWDMAEDTESFTIRAFVRAPYDRFVREETRFWDASGISVKMGASGLDIQVESLRAVLLGGIAFDTSPQQMKSAEATREQSFPLFANQQAASFASYRRSIPLTSSFSSSVRGLGPGSEVTVHGMKVGEVKNVRLAYDLRDDSIQAAVDFDILPERIVGVGKQAYDTPQQAAETMVRNGWRSTLDTANLLTGQQVIALDRIPDAAPATVSVEDGRFVVPVVQGAGIASLASAASDLLKQVNEIPFRQIGGNLDELLRSANETIGDPQVRQALRNLDDVLARTKSLVANLDSGAAPALKQLPQIASSLDRALASVNTLATSLNRGYGGDTKFSRDVDRLLLQLNDAVRSLRSLADLLARHPEALIRGRPAGATE